MKELLEIIEQEQKKANEHYVFHRHQGDKYGLAQYFDGQRTILRKLKRKVKAISILNKT